MNLLDSFIGFFSPEAGYRRTVYREELKALKSYAYDAANHARLNAGWPAINEPAFFTDKIDAPTLRARSRDLERNSDIYNSIISSFVRNCVKEGFTLQARTPKEKLNTQIEDLFYQWSSNANNFDVTATQNLNQMLRMITRRCIVDGGILIIKTYDKKAAIPLKLQALEVDCLTDLATSPKKAGNKVVNGIEYTPQNKIYGYWIAQYSVDGLMQENPVFYQAKDVIFLFNKNRPTQIREVPMLAHVISRIRDINEFMTAVSVKERVSACLGLMIKKSNPAVGGWGRAQTMTNERGGSQYAGKKLTPGMILELAAGDDASVLDPKSSSTDANSFLNTMQHLISSGVGISYESISRDMSRSTYSSARQGAIEDDLTFTQIIDMLRTFLNDIYEEFITAAVMSNTLIINDYFNNKGKYLNHEFLSSSRRWVDPLKEANAQISALNAGVKTYADVCAENGKDWRDQIDSIAAINEYAKTKGLSLNTALNMSDNTTTAADAGNTEDQNNDKDN